ncbi:MAG: hypothetical protein AAF591_05540 [Verrucomicrobiota bacterium]
MISLEESKELEAKGELDADFDLDICFEDEGELASDVGVEGSAAQRSGGEVDTRGGGESLPDLEASEAGFEREGEVGATVDSEREAPKSESESESESERESRVELEAHLGEEKEEATAAGLVEKGKNAAEAEEERWELPPKREPELPPLPKVPPAEPGGMGESERGSGSSSEWKWSKDEDFDPLRDLPRRDAGRASESKETASRSPMADLPPPPEKGEEKKEDVPVYELPPKEKGWKPDPISSEREGEAAAFAQAPEVKEKGVRAKAKEKEVVGLPVGGEGDGGEDRVLPSPLADADEDSDDEDQFSVSDDAATSLAAASAPRRRRRPVQKSRLPALLVVISCLMMIVGGGTWYVLQQFDFGGGPELEQLGSEETLRRFLTAETANDRVNYVWKSDQLRAAVGAHYVKNGYEKPNIGGLRKMQEIEVGDTEGTLVADVYEAQLSTRGATVCYVIRRGDAVLGVDWESFEDLTQTPFSRFQSERMSTATTFRAHAFQDDALWTGRFDDPNRWYCLRLESPKGAWSVFAYAEKNSIIGEQIRQIFNFTDNEIMTVALAYPVGAEAEDQVLLERIVSLDWLTEQ